MEKIKEIRAIVLIVAITISIVAVILTCGFVAKSQNNESEEWVIRSYGKNVALYKGEEVIEVYGAISLDNLPNSDKKLLDNGIVFQTRNEALRALEDYDG